MEGYVKNSAWYEEASKKFFEEPETDVAFNILKVISTQGLTVEQAEGA